MSSPKESRSKRDRQIRHIQKVLPSDKSLQALGDPKKLPMLGLYAATQRYLSEAYTDCVLHSAFSVEMALLLKLDEEMKAIEKEQIKKQSEQGAALSFGKIILLAEKRHVLVGEDTNKIWILYNLRNMFVHPGNWVAFVKQQSPEGAVKMIAEMIPDLPSRIQRIKNVAEQEAQSLRKILEELQRYVVTKLGKIPSLDWAAHQGTLGFQQKRTRSYYERIVKDFLTRETLEDFIRHSDDFPQYARSRYPYPQEIALEALEIAFDILKHLGTFSTSS